MLPRIIRLKQRIALSASIHSSRLIRVTHHLGRLCVSKARYQLSGLAAPSRYSHKLDTNAIIWISEYYQSKNPLRQQEINRSLQANSQLTWISRRLLAFDGISEESPPFSFELLGRSRLTFAAFARLANEQYKQNKNSLLILTNNDIELTDDILRLAPWIRTNDVICLSRHEPNLIGFEHPPEIFQDCWIMRAQPIAAEVIHALDFYLGIPGCDNRYAAIMKQAGFQVWNPCINTRIIHHHRSSVRSTTRNRLTGLYYEPYACSLEDYIMRRQRGGLLRRVVS